MLWTPCSGTTRSSAVFSAWVTPQFDFAPLLSTAIDAECELQEDCEPLDDGGLHDVDVEWPPPDSWNEVDDEPPVKEQDPPAAPPQAARAVVRRRCGNRRPAQKLPPVADPVVAPSFSSETLPMARRAYIAKAETRTDKLGAKKRYTLAQLIALGFQLIEWDGITDRLIVDTAGRVWASLAGQPNADSWYTAVSRAYELIKLEGSAAHFPATTRHHRHGLLAAINVGLAYGKGLSTPTWLDNHGYTPLTERLLAYAFALWAPRLHTYYINNNSKLQALLPNHHRPFPKSVFSCATFNFGPCMWTFKHRDIYNLPFGWCAVQALGLFDHTKGGHLVLWDAKLVVQFPAGALILLPSATVAHSNVPVQEGEEQISFTQFTAGGLFRWVNYGGRTEAQLAAEDPDEYSRVLVQRDK
ncbi:hypothetical protein MSAN_00968500 [Mycena sanguinolenta]|uniref:Uncharacterized protein n=1 Tax=Mycena sanguinolenta TaxID=230812 RepID=A0A8H7DAA4_9AGAR|nr:hypothetical protein MSAN_00968500 [Mycena sanguinolenta]